jgi:hypothetical protein
MSSDINGYFARLRAHLRLSDGAEDDLLRELSAHVEDRSNALVARGMAPERARRAAIHALGRPQTLAHLLRQAQSITSWRESAFGASAFLLMALLIGPGLWHEPLAAIAGGGLIIGVAVYGLWLGRPAWFYPWAGSALTIPIVIGYVAFALLHREVGHAIDGTITPAGLAGIAGAALYFPIGLIVVAACVVVAVRRDWLDASVLLSPLPCALVWVIGIHRADGIMADGAAGASGASAMAGGIFVCMSVVMLMFLRAPLRSVKVTTLVASSVVLLAGATFLIDPNGDLMTLTGRGALLLAFLLSPALVARHA